MGLAASQARLLTITSRLHDIELKQQTVANQKMRLANESDEVYNAYAKALNTQRFTVNSSPISLSDLYKPGSNYQLKTKSGKMVLTPDLAATYRKNIVGGYSATWFEEDKYKATYDNPGSRRSEAEAEFCLQMLTGKAFWREGYADYDDLEDKFGKDAVDYYRNLFTQMFDASTVSADGRRLSATLEYVEVDKNLINDPNWLFNAIESGEFILVKNDGTQVTPTGADFGTEYDKSAIAKAEAKYNAETNKLNRKEKQLDNDARKLDTEYSAMNTELESTKSIMKGNSDRTFNLFS